MEGMVERPARGLPASSDRTTAELRPISREPLTPLAGYPLAAESKRWSRREGSGVPLWGACERARALGCPDEQADARGADASANTSGVAPDHELPLNRSGHVKPRPPKEEPRTPEAGDWIPPTPSLQVKRAACRASR